MFRVSILSLTVFVCVTTLINSTGNAQTPTIVLVEPARTLKTGSSVASNADPKQVEPNSNQTDFAKPPETGSQGPKIELPKSDNAVVPSLASASHFENTGYSPIVNATSIPTVIPSQTVPFLASAESPATAEVPEPNPLHAANNQSSSNGSLQPVIAVRPSPLRPINASVDSSYQVCMEPLPGDANQFRMTIEIPESVREMEIAPKYSESSRRIRVTIDHENGIVEAHKNDSAALSTQSAEQHRTIADLAAMHSKTDVAYGQRKEDRKNFLGDTRPETASHRQFQKNPYFNGSNSEVAQNRMLRPISNPYATTEYRVLEEAPQNIDHGLAQQGRNAAGPANAPVQIQLSDESVNRSGTIHR